MKRTVLFLCPLLLAGCASKGPAVNPKVAREARILEETRIVREEVARMKGRIEEMEYRIGKIASEQAERSRKTEEALRATGRETAAVKERMLKTEKETDRRFKVLLEEVQRENEELRKAVSSIKVPSYATGYEHVVQRGDTLSGIAKEYGSRISAIMEANEIEDPNTLRVGQKLFVPK